jgi:uncharacterized protein
MNRPDHDLRVRATIHQGLQSVMKYYFYRLTVSRPTFLSDMTSDEKVLMQKHNSYLQDLLAKKKAIVFGPVADPAGLWGAGVLQLDDGEDAQALMDADPIIQQNIGFSCKLLPMPSILSPV